jgi:polyphosphate kinase 2 (PPK2 family)
VPELSVSWAFAPRRFLETVPAFEAMIQRSGITLLKHYLDISKQEQKRRLADRQRDPLKQWKLSPIDAKAQKYWKAYSEARDEMLERTHTVTSPWTLVRPVTRNMRDSMSFAMCCGG